MTYKAQARPWISFSMVQGEDAARAAHIFGQISAANALSDIYAMCDVKGSPVLSVSPGNTWI